MLFSLRYFTFVGLFLCLVGSSQAAESVDTHDGQYRIHPGDVLEVSVWKEENMQREILVRPDGEISFPLVGSVPAAGKTISELRQDIVNGLNKFIPDPVVTVGARSLNGNVIYVIGKVARPGPFQIGSFVDVVQALSLAGGTTTYAGVNKIKVLRRNQQGKLVAIPFKYGEIEKGKNLEQSIILHAGDVVLVP